MGEVKIHVRDGLPIVDGVYVNGYGPYRFLIDTGTSVNLIEEKLAKSIGLIAAFRTELTTSSSASLLPGVDGIEVALDSVKADGQKFLFLRLEAMRDRWLDIMGVLGQCFLSRFDYVLDLQRGRLHFQKQNRNGTRVRLTVINGRPTITTSLGDLILDSGAAQLVLFGVKPDFNLDDRRELRTFAGSLEIGTIFTKPLIIEGRKIWRGNAVAVPHPAESGVGGLLPLSFFKAVYVCNSEGYVVFE